MNNNDKNDLGLFAVIFGAIFGTLYGAYKLLSGADDRRSASNAEQKKVRAAVDELFLDGKDEFVIANALLLSANEQLGDGLTEKRISQIKLMVIEEKMKLEKEGKLPVQIP